MDEFCTSYNYDTRKVRKVRLKMSSVLITIHIGKTIFLILSTNWGTSTAKHT